MSLRTDAAGRRPLLPRRLGAALWPAVALALITACRGRDEARAAGAEPVRRAVAAAAWDTLWVAGGADADSLLLLPTAVAADSERVYVLDAGGHRVVALNARDGSLAWTAGRRGSGPGEFLALTALAVDTGGNVVVADERNARLSVLDSRGRSVREVRFPGVGYVQAMCPLADGGMLLATQDVENPLVLMDSAGSVRARYGLPWADLNAAPPLARQAALAPVPGHGGCVLALRGGRGFATFRDGRFAGTHPYLERFDPAQVKVTQHGSGVGSTVVHEMSERRIAALDVAAAGDSIFVTFEGRTDLRSRLIDVYRAGTGEYLKSYAFSRPINRSARAGGVFFLLHTSKGYPTLVAARPHAGPVPGKSN